MAQQTRRSVLQAATRVAGRVLVGGAAAGCGSTRPGPSAPPRRLQVIVGADRSTSFRRQLPAAAQAAVSLVLHLRPEDRLTCFRVADECQEFYDRAPPAGRQRVTALFAKALFEVPPLPGTNPAAFWKHAAERAAVGTDPVAIVFFTDGQDERPDQEPLIRRAAAALAANARVMVIAFSGPQPEEWARLRRLFHSVDTLPAGAADGRLQLSSDFDMDRLLKLLAALRQQATR